jgi:DNA-binding PadR family transcriptional regulator
MNHRHDRGATRFRPEEMAPGFRTLWTLFGRGPRARRGDVRSGILALLAQRACNGYRLMQDLEQRSGGVWRPSPGSIYPTLQELEDQGLIKAEADGNGRIYRLTKQGWAHLKAQPDAVTNRDKDSSVRAGEAAGHELHQRGHALMSMLHQIGVAAMQVARVGSTAQVEHAQRLLADTRRSLYRILAEDEDLGA